MRVSVDTNILVYAIDVDAGEKHVAASRLVERIARLDSVLCLQVLGEFFHVTTRKFGLAAGEARAYVSDWTSVFSIVAAENGALEQAMVAVERHSLSFWDAMLWATLKAASCRILFSEDFQDARRLDGVTFVNPFDPANRRLVETVLPPDES